MKVILLRHEKREDYSGYFSNLTDDGLKDSFKLEKKLSKMNIDKIYSSPFVRTLQTIFPYALKQNKKVNVEYALYEYKHNPYFLTEPQIYEVKDMNNEYINHIINKRYKSYVNKDEDFNFQLLENETHLENRVKKFLDYLKSNKTLKNKTLLIVTHKGVINKIKGLINKKTKMDDDFPMGSYEIINLD